MKTKLQLERENHEDKVVIFANTSEGKEEILVITTRDKEMRDQLADAICAIPSLLTKVNELIDDCDNLSSKTLRKRIKKLNN